MNNTKRVRLGTLGEGDVFHTALSNRRGVVEGWGRSLVRDWNDVVTEIDSVFVHLVNPYERKTLHPDTVVLVGA